VGDQPQGEAAVWRQPLQVLGAHPAGEALNPPHWHLKPYPLIKPFEIGVREQYRLI
jgi:hypothetical protein